MRTLTCALSRKEASGWFAKNHCADCAEETTVPYLAVKSANGKMSDLTILQFESSADRNRYKSAWLNNTAITRASHVICLNQIRQCLE